MRIHKIRFGLCRRRCTRERQPLSLTSSVDGCLAGLQNTEDMNIAGSRFQGLRGNPKRWSVRVTGNYRITFGWSGESALDVDFEDYH